MAELFEIVEGWTEELEPFTLKKAGSPIDLTNLMVTLLLTPHKANTPKTLTGTTRVDADQSALGNRGKVYYKPSATDLLASESPYSIRWKIQDQGGNVVFVPSEGQDTISVVKA